jgi:transitional endoplasmic reticulum ATPase
MPLQPSLRNGGRIFLSSSAQRLGGVFVRNRAGKLLTGDSPTRYTMTAIKQLKTQLHSTPKDTDLLYRLACEYRKANFFPQAIQYFKEALTVQANPAIHYALGSLYLEIKCYPDAARSFENILQLSPDSADAHAGLGEAYAGMKKYASAAERHARAVELQPHSAGRHYGLARILHRLGKEKQALGKYRDALKLDPDHTEAHFYLGYLYCKDGQFAEAVQELQMAARRKPDCAEIHTNLGFAYLQCGRVEDAAKAYQQALRLNPRLQEAQASLEKTNLLLSNKKTLAAPPPAPSAAQQENTTPVALAIPAPARQPSKGLARVAGMKDLKRLLFEEVLRPFREPELYRRFRLNVPNGILLYGPPGCGKTYIAKQLAEELGWNFLEVQASSIGSVYIHGTVLAIRDIFKEAEANAPTLLFIDEFEGLVPKRADLTGQQQHKAEEVSEFLLHFNECAKRKIFVVAATNEPNKIDEAMRRPGRLDKIVFVGPPDLEARLQALDLFFQDRPVDRIDFGKHAKNLEGYPFSDISNIADESARLALRQGKLFIANEHLAEAIRRNPSSLSSQTLSRYRNFQQRGI